MNAYRKKYDFIIYGASFAGIVLAMKYRSMHKSVLLLNKYGFVGGSITESLNCYQRIDMLNYQSLAKNLFLKISKEKNSLLFKNENYVLFNPETVKYILQKKLEEYDVDLLFHVQPLEVKIKENKITELVLFGREGKINFESEIFIDTSSNYQLVGLISTKNRVIQKLFYNFFLSSKSELPNHVITNAKKLIKLSDESYWASVKIDSSDEFFIENQSQKFINELTEELKKNNTRIQTLPAQTHIIYDINVRGNLQHNLYWIERYLDKKYNEEEELIISSEIEMKI